MSKLALAVFNPEAQLSFELDVRNICDQGRATDLLRQRGPLGAVHLYLPTPAGPASVAEASNRMAQLGIEAPLTIANAALALMHQQGSGSLVIHGTGEDPDALECAGALPAATNAFWREWVAVQSAERRLGKHSPDHQEAVVEAPGVGIEFRE